MIYLDYTANTPVDSEVLNKFVETESKFIGNPNSNHQEGKKAKEELAKITENIASLLNVEPSEIIYTSGASESNNLAIKGITDISQGKHIITTKLEHSSVFVPIEELKKKGFIVDYAPLDKDGKINIPELIKIIRPDTALIAICLVDGELGIIQPINKIAEEIKKVSDCKIHIDGTQALGKIKIDFKNIDTMSFSAHKIYGLNGSGILFKRGHLKLNPQISGGMSSSLYRSGTPTLSLNSAFYVAVKKAIENQEKRFSDVEKKNKNLREFFKQFPKVKINSPQNAVPHIINLSVEGIKGSVFQRKLNSYGVCVSVKSACSSDGLPSRAVTALGNSERTALSSWRISLSHLTTWEEIEQFKENFVKLV